MNMRSILSPKNQSLLNHVYMSIEPPKLSDVNTIFKLQYIYTDLFDKKYDVRALWRLTRHQVEEVRKQMENTLLESEINCANLAGKKHPLES